MRSRLNSTILWLAFWLAFAPLSAHGAATVSTPHAAVTLASEQPHAAPGQTLWLGLRFDLVPHWHVYWHNPGASGAAPTIRWTLPAGWTAGEIRWPVPERIRVGPLTNYGYEGTVTFLVPVRIPDSPPPAGPITLVADADWLVCRVECVPESGRFVLQLPLPGSPAVESAEARSSFAAARARWPETGGATGRYRTADDSLSVAVDLPDSPALDPADVWFAAHEWGPVDPSRPQSWERTATGFALRVPVGDVPPANAAPLDGLLVVEAADGGPAGRRGYAVRLTAAPSIDKSAPGLATALGFAFLGGLILNLMPCVLPVLGIKVLGFVRDGGADRRRRIGRGLSYGAGILLSFLVLAAGLLALRAGGESLGWGFQLQSPAVVAALAYLMLLVGLNLSGVYSVGGGLMGAGQSLTAGHGLGHAFATGVLAAVVASPCTAPFMGAALGFAITRPAGEALAVFLALGFGFALPVMLLSLAPSRLRFIPKPGPWMQRLQQSLAFPLYATVAWLLWVLSQQTDAHAYGIALAGLVLVALAAWLYGQWRPRGWRLGLLGAGLAVALILVLRSLVAPDAPASARAEPGDAPWSEARVRELTAAGRPVFVNFTAAWCITCKVNERVALTTADTRRRFAERSVVYLVADWTRRDPAITRQLERHGRSGVPLYLLYLPMTGEPVALPQLLTESIVAEALQSL